MVNEPYRGELDRLWKSIDGLNRRFDDFIDERLRSVVNKSNRTSAFWTAFICCLVSAGAVLISAYVR